MTVIVPRQFVLVDNESQEISADGVFVFAVWVLSWRDRIQAYATYPDLDSAISADGSNPDDYTLRWGLW